MDLAGGSNEIEHGPHARFPQDPDFYRRVLEGLPTPVVVLDDHGRVVYGNWMAREVGGWSIDEGVGMNTFDQIHPDDLDWAASIFASVLEAPADEHRLPARPWGAVEFRMLSANGDTIPLHVTGAGALADPVVNGVIFDLRPAWWEDLNRRVTNALATGRPNDEVLDLIVRMVAVPPIPIDSALIDVGPDGQGVIAASLDRLRTVMSTDVGSAPWAKPADEPTVVLTSEIDGQLGVALRDAGYLDCWSIAVETPFHDVDLRLVACTPLHGAVDNSIRQRLRDARDLVALALERSHYDERLKHAAHHDSLTGLPNRLTIYERIAQLAESHERIGMLFVDLDGFKPVNDQFGHVAGDEVLRCVADRLASVMRSVDLCARLGGDEFAVVVGDPVDADVLGAIMRRIETALGEPVAIAGGDVVVAASVGAVLADASLSTDRIVGAADEEMYAVKSGTGRAGTVRVLTA